MRHDKLKYSKIIDEKWVSVNNRIKLSAFLINDDMSIPRIFVHGAFISSSKKLIVIFTQASPIESETVISHICEFAMTDFTTTKLSTTNQVL